MSLGFESFSLQHRSLEPEKDMCVIAMLLPCLQEKRKRDMGQAKSAKNYVEEEKRLARNFGMYSGFDT